MLCRRIDFGSWRAWLTTCIAPASSYLVRVGARVRLKVGVRVRVRVRVRVGVRARARVRVRVGGQANLGDGALLLLAGRLVLAC